MLTVLILQVVEFWAWVIQDPGVALQLEFKPSRWQYYHSGPEQRRQQQALLESLMVNGKSVLAPSTSSQHNFAIKAGLGSAVVLCIVVAVVVGLVLVRRNRQLLRTVQRMKFDLGEELDHDLQWNLEVESPINKAINFLRVRGFVCP